MSGSAGAGSGGRRIALLVSAFNGLSQRVWCALRDAGHEVPVVMAGSAGEMTDAIGRIDPDLVLCPYLTHRVPAEVWRVWPTVVIHPGPLGDRGPSSLDWAITEAASVWGVTALQAVEEMDAGPIWATRTFTMPAEAPRKSDLYSGPVADAAMECVDEVLRAIATPGFAPAPQDQLPRMVASALTRPMMRQADRSFDWGEDADDIVRTIRAADGSPGVRTEIAGVPVFAYDAHVGPSCRGEAGTVSARRAGAILVRTGGRGVWLGQLRAVPTDGRPTVKLPAARVLARHRSARPDPVSPLGATGDGSGPPSRIHYRRAGAVGEVTVDCYNGALSTSQCQRLLDALRYAARQDTRVLVLRGGWTTFCNGIHLGVIEAAPHPAAAAWDNIRAINAVCRELIECTNQVTVAALTGGAGAGGAMLALGADRVVARDGVVLNPFYDMGLFGSELHTYTLPRRVGAAAAADLLTRRLPISAQSAQSCGMVDAVGPRQPADFSAWLAELATDYAEPRTHSRILATKNKTLEHDGTQMPLDACEARELGEMAQDMFADRNGFASARAAFVYKRPSWRPRIAARGPRVLTQRALTGHGA